VRCAAPSGPWRPTKSSSSSRKAWHPHGAQLPLRLNELQLQLQGVQGQRTVAQAHPQGPGVGKGSSQRPKAPLGRGTPECFHA